MTAMTTPFDFDTYDPRCPYDDGCGFTPCECQLIDHPTFEQAIGELVRLQERCAWLEEQF